MLSCVQLFVTLWTRAHQAPLSMGFSRQEYCSGLPSPSPGDFPDPKVEPRSLALQPDSLPSKLSGKHTYEKEESYKMLNENQRLQKKSRRQEKEKINVEFLLLFSPEFHSKIQRRKGRNIIGNSPHQKAL